ncbi:hypothetical protein OSTOST_24106, partial [Ostertagia ostertagi]
MQWRDQQTPLATLRGYCKKIVVELTPTIMYKVSNDIGLKILGIEFWHSQVQQELDQRDQALSQRSQRSPAGKEAEEKRGSEADDADKEKEEESRRKGYDDDHMLKWQRGDEIRAKRASVAQHGERTKQV